VSWLEKNCTASEIIRQSVSLFKICLFQLSVMHDNNEWSFQPAMTDNHLMSPCVISGAEFPLLHKRKRQREQ